MPFEIPAAIVGDHVLGYPVTPAAAQEYAGRRVIDRLLPGQYFRRAGDDRG